MKKLKMNMRYFMQLRQSPSMTQHLATQRMADLSKFMHFICALIQSSASKRPSVAPVWPMAIYFIKP